MNDNEIFKLLIAEIKKQLDFYGLTDYVVAQANQQTFQAAETKTLIALSVIADTKIGSERKYKNGEIVMSHLHKMTLQIDVSTPYSTDSNSFTARDISNALSDILQFPDVISRLRFNSIHLHYVTDIRPTVMANDSDNFELNSSFDLTITYPKTYAKPSLRVQNINNIIEGV